MKFSLFINAFLLLFLAAQGQVQFKPLRYDEDYSYLSNKDAVKSDYEKMKYMPVSKSKNTYFSFGGEARFQYFYVKNENWGEEPLDKDGYTLGRYLFHTDFHVGKRFRTFVQLQSSLVNGKVSTSPVEENPLEVHQAFMDVSPLIADKAKLTVRIGRQELSYGSQRLISVREIPNNRQSFDAAKVIFQTKNSQTDIFYSQYVVARKGIFDDRSSKDLQLWGVYYTTTIPIIENIDLYYLGYKKRNAVINDVSGKEHRHSLGTRLWNSNGNWLYDFEALYQLGDVEGKNISAWTASINTSYKFRALKLYPEIGIKTELISGDLHKGDNKVQTFNPMFPKGAYFGLAALIGPSNLTDIHPYLNLKLNKKIDLSVDYDIFWRFSTADGIYAVNMSPIYGDAGSKKKHIGNQLTAAMVLSPNKYLSLRTELTWFKSGSYLKEASTGKDILFAGITAQVRF